MPDDLTFPQIVEGLSAPMATTTADGRVDLANRPFLDFIGLSLEELGIDCYPLSSAKPAYDDFQHGRLVGRGPERAADSRVTHEVSDN